MTRPTQIFAASLLVLSGCVLELPDTIRGRWWCATATGANGTRNDNSADVDIIKNGAYVGGCVDMCPFQMDIMEAGEAGMIGTMHPQYADWQDLRNDVLDAGVFFCEQREAQLEASFGTSIHFNSMNDISCQEAIDAVDPVEGGIAQIPPSDCSAQMGDESGEEQGSGPGLYGLTAYSEVMNCSGTTNRTCNVDLTFIADMLAQPELVWSDDAFLQPYSMSGTTGFRFTTCASSSLMYALGFRVNDTLTHIDGMAVTNNQSTARDLWGHLGNGNYSSAKATFKRGTVTQTLTIVKVNLPSYP